MIDLAEGLMWGLLGVFCGFIAAFLVHVARLMLAARRMRRRRAEQWKAWRP